MIIKTAYTMFFISVILLSGCVKDKITPPVTVEFENVAELIYYLEETGDYINSPLAPSIVEATEVYNNLTNYLVIDLRPSGEFAAGHIEGSVNVNHQNILTHITNTTRSYPKIILVSKNGQSSAYYTGLLRLYGINNIFSMNYGMASWNKDFAEDWLFIIQPIQLSDIADWENPKGRFHELPQLEFDQPSASPENKVKNRIINLLGEEFSEAASFDENSPSIFRDEFFISTDVKICYGDKALYVSKLYGIYHPSFAYYFSPPAIEADFKSTRYLQVLPTEARILLYSHEGNLSAFTAAYLRTLGYNAASLLFGGNALYSHMALVPPLAEYAFTENKIMNYPYVQTP